ncbi:uncharacterized protein LOC123682531 [Harmonia axyridis]|uniref:uncharacterized protein LOC123682531 n=1 Tax=Harmonia axyridis TaxID=115357 RepID=UPI001E2798C8|nr:uncharacterized protein LOC123682531 [Harmonia axyridis]
MDFLRILKPKRNKFSEELITQTVDLENEDVIKETPEQTEDILSFRVDYLGSLQIHSIPEFNPEKALKALKHERESKKKKPQRGVILISKNFVILTDMRRNEIFKIPLLRIQSCSMDPFNKNVFFFINENQNRRKTYNAFFSEKWKMAYNAAQAIAHMFSQSHDRYLRELQDKKFFSQEKKEENKEDSFDQRCSLDMMDFSIDSSQNKSENEAVSKNWISFDD